MFFFLTYVESMRLREPVNPIRPSTTTSLRWFAVIAGVGASPLAAERAERQHGVELGSPEIAQAKSLLDAGTISAEHEAPGGRWPRSYGHPVACKA